MSHASNFRDGKAFIDRRRVLVVGSGPSGSDIAREIAVYADHVYVTTRPFETDDTPDTMVRLASDDLPEGTSRGSVLSLRCPLPCDG
jgi:thioredoxin reductase